MIWDAPPGVCVRCGGPPRRRGTYLCGLCLADPDTEREVAEVYSRSAGDYIMARRRAIEVYRWRGGWGRP